MNNLANFIRGRLFSLIFFVFFHGHVGISEASLDGLSNQDKSVKPTYSSPTKPVCESTEAPPWPLELLDEKERAARLRFFLDLYRFKVIVDRTAGEEVCAPLLVSLLDLKNVKILQRVTNSSYETTCKNIRDLTQYHSFKKLTLPSIALDHGASSQAPTQKENDADFFYRPTSRNYTEYYDLSEYLGTNTWGLLSEGIAKTFHPQYAQKFCLRKWDFYTSAGVLGRVFNPQTCSAYFLPVLAGSVQRIIGSAGYFDMSPSFAAYVDIDKKLYMLTLVTSFPWNKFHELLTNEVIPPQIMLIPLVNPNTIVADIPSTSSCLYEAEIKH